MRVSQLLIFLFGASSIVSGLAARVLFHIYLSDVAGRIEMGQFALIQFRCYAAGLSLILVYLVRRRPPADKVIVPGSAAWFLWFFAVFASLYAVAVAMPP